MTKEERLLWQYIRRKQLDNVQFYRQYIIGNYIVDFYSKQANLIIEIDGAVHYTENGIGYDKVRDEYIKACGLNVLRFTNKDVRENISGVLENIRKAIPPRPSLTSKGGSKKGSFPLIYKGDKGGSYKQ